MPGRLLALGSAAAGVGLFAYAISRVGAGAVWRDTTRLGWGFFIVLALSGVRLYVRAATWTRCLEGPDRLSAIPALRAFLMGEALGNLTPLGLVVSEPAKAAFVRARVPVADGLAALAVENVFYSLSVATVIGLGMLVLIGRFPIPDGLRAGAVLTLGAAALVLSGAGVVLLGRMRPADALARLATGEPSPSNREPGTANHQPPTASRVQRWVLRVVAAEERVLGFSRRHPGRLPAIFGLTTLFHVAGWAEAYVVLWWLGVPVTPAGAFVFEAVNRVINVLFRFVPLRLGVDEAGTGGLAHLLGYGPAAGVTLAVIRKARVLAWSAAGVALMIERSLDRDSR